MQAIARDNFLQTLAGTRPGGRDGAGFCSDILQESERERERGGDWGIKPYFIA